MRADGVRRCAAAVLPLALAACTSMAAFVRPEGDGGWSPAARTQELGRRAAAAAVDLEANPTAPDDSQPIDLATALARAAGGNRRIAEAQRELARARERVAEARGRLLPATRARGRHTRYSDALTTTVALPADTGLAGPPPTVEIRDRTVGTITAALTVPLDVSGELRATLAAAQAGFRGEAARLWATELEQGLVVIGAYFALLEAERLHGVTAQTIAVQREQLANAEQRHRQGRLTKNELLVVQVGLQDAEQRLRQRALAIDRARWALNVAMGRPVDAPTRVVDVRTRPTLPAERTALTAAYADNPLLAALLEEQQRLEATARAHARGRLPRLSAGATLDESTSDVVEPSLVGAGFVGLAWDLGTDGRRAARAAGARIAADQNRVRIERELRGLERAVRATHRAAAERLTALDSAATAVGQAEENLRIRQQQFAVGRATSENVLDAEALLATQRAVLASALYQAHTRRAELQRLMGRPLAELVAEWR